MAITINGSDGISDLRSTTDGSASTPAIRGTDTNTGIFFPAADTIAFAEGGTEVARFDSSGNLGIGVTSPAVEMVLFKNTSNPRFQIQNSTSGTTNVDGLQVALVGSDGYLWNFENGNSIFGTNGTERMRINSSGRVLVNATSTFGGMFQSTGIAGSVSAMALRVGQNGDGALEWFNGSGGYVAAVSVNASTVAYGTSSDYRLKDNIAPMTGALEKVAQLKPSTWSWKSTGENGQGFIAHELQEVCPDAVAGEKDAVNEDGSIKAQGIDTSFLVATLTAAIQEQQAIITEQANAITALEARLTALEQA
jgi:hypothetical protein